MILELPQGAIIAIVIVVILLVIVLGWYISTMNNLRRLEIKVEESLSGIDIALTKRFDVLTKMLDTTKGYAKHEKETLAELTRARNLAMEQGGVASADAQNKISQTLKSLFAVAEDYPELKANQNFLELQRELADTETKIQATRQFYNSVVMGLNTQIEQFPSNLVANMFNIQPEKMFEIDESEKVAPQVKF